MAPSPLCNLTFTDAEYETMQNATWDVCKYESETDAALDEKIGGLMAAVDFAYYFLCGVMVFLMQLGFAMLEVGCVNVKNINNIILKGVLDICIAAIFYWACGFSFAFGTGNGFIGGGGYWFGDCLDGVKDGPCTEDHSAGYAEFFFQFAFAATAATIVSGAVAERTTTLCYVAYSIVLTAFVYPVVVHWQWGGGYTSGKGAVDYAGSAVVHMTGGLAAIVGAAIIGPRAGRFEGTIFKVKVNDMPAYSVVFTTLGTLILWFGWYGFNTGSTLGITWVYSSGALGDGMTAPGNSEAGLIVLNTTLAPAAAGLTAMLLAALGSMMAGDGFIIKLAPVLNGILAGLVSITAGCGDVRPGSAVVLGIVGGFVYTATSNLQKQLMIDDVVDAGPVHFWCGIWGTLGLALFADDTGTGLTGLGGADFVKYSDGVFYGSGNLLGANLTLVCLVIVWVAPTMALLFGGLKALGVARVSKEVEALGLDASKHGVNSITAQPVPANDKTPGAVVAAGPATVQQSPMPQTDVKAEDAPRPAAGAPAAAPPTVEP